MTAREIAAAMTRLGAETFRDHMLGDPVLTPRLGFAVARRAGLVCFSSTRLDTELFDHVAGYGTFAAATQSAIDRVLRHYDGLGAVARIEVLVPGVSRSARALLLRNGFRHARTPYQCHVRTTSRPPRTRRLNGFTVARVAPADAEHYARQATRGFGGGGTIARVFEHGWIRQIRRGRGIAAFLGSLDGRTAATGVLLLRPAIAGLYSGSVLPEFRGRGIQNAMIAERLTYGWARGVRTFYSMTDPESASARNLRDEGFRTRSEVHIYQREA